MSELWYGENSKNSQNAYVISQLTINKLAKELEVVVDTEVIDGVTKNVVSDKQGLVLCASDSPLAIYHFLNGMLSVKGNK